MISPHLVPNPSQMSLQCKRALAMSCTASCSCFPFTSTMTSPGWTWQSPKLGVILPLTAPRLRNIQITQTFKAEKQVKKRFSDNRKVWKNSRRLWLSEIPCWKGFPANFDAAGQLFKNFPAARNAIHAKVWAFSGGKWLLENRPAFENAPGFSPLRPRHSLLEFF